MIEPEPITTQLFVGPLRDYVAEGGEHHPSRGLSYSYAWGARSLGRGDSCEYLTVLPAVLTPTGLLSFPSLKAARDYCLDAAQAGPLVITLRLHDPEQSRLVSIERADYCGYLWLLSFASQLTGLPFNELAAGEGTYEDDEPLAFKIARLRKLRRQGKDIQAEELENAIRTDFRQRHFRNIR